MIVAGLLINRIISSNVFALNIKKKYFFFVSQKTELYPVEN